MDPSVVIPANGHVAIGGAPLSLPAQATRLAGLAVALSLDPGGPYDADETDATGEPLLTALVARYNTVQGLIADVGAQLDPDTATVADIAAAIDTLATIGTVPA